ncbi:hypothetical protein NIES4102_38900 [Chondrocystis sp. NIES-4102]|nr:hypothetical protein NIES4102_38900 [Chondrocystis sp. NIES-4102]
MTNPNRVTTRIRKPRFNPRHLWLERLMAMIAVANLIIVGFDLSYVPLRDFWHSGQVTVGGINSAYLKLDGIELDLIPESVSQIVTKYDAVKGIIPNTNTTEYLAKVDQLQQALTTNDLNSPLVNNIMGDLRRRSLEIIQTNAFSQAHKTANLERIKNRMRSHIPNRDNTAETAFWLFWTPVHFEGKVDQEFEFFQREIQPLMARNYDRLVGENRAYVDYFGLIDFPIGMLFAFEFLVRTWFISRRRTGVSWLDAMLWRWYDLFFIFPIWRWLRILPVIIRLNQARFINLNAIQRQVSQGIVAEIAEDVTEVVIIRIINQIQTSIRNGELGRLLSQSSHAYIDINNTNEIAEIIRIVVTVVVEQVLPAIQPEAETLLQYSFDKALKQSPAYQGIKLLPGGDRTLTGLSRQLGTQAYSAFSGALQTVLAEDKQFDRLMESLIANVGKIMSNELQGRKSLSQIEFLLIDLLEEIKINYVERLSKEDIEDILEQTRSLRQLTINK